MSKFTGDGAGRDHEGYYWIRGRVDDVVNVSGHRLSTAEIEAALIEHHAVAEAAVVGINDELTGQAVNAFVAIKDGNEINDQLRKDLILQVRKSIGPFAAPKAIFVVPDLPKTRSGKIMRRILRKILAGEEDQLGDTSTVCSRLSIEWAGNTNSETALRSKCCRLDHPDCARIPKEVEEIRENRRKTHPSVCKRISGRSQSSHSSSVFLCRSPNLPVFQIIYSRTLKL